MLLVESLAEREDTYYNTVYRQTMRKFASFEVGLVVSRQNGKGSLLEARELAGLFLLGERLIIHSAHQFDTSKEAFQRIEALISGTPELKKEVAHIRWSHGEEGIELKNGQRLRFRTRTKGGGRGFTADCLILDEAMILTTDQVGALLPTLSARPNPQLWYTGSAGDQSSQQLGRVRSRGIARSDPRLMFAEWSVEPCTDFCDKDCQEGHDPTGTPASDHPISAALVEAYAKSNPGLGIRISVEHIESERRSMDAATFERERLGVGDWPIEGDAWRVIDEESWHRQVDEFSRPMRPIVFSVDVTPDRSWACIAVAGLNDAGLTHVEMTGEGLKYDHRQGTKWVMKRLVELYKRHNAQGVVIDRGGQAGEFYDELEAMNGINVLIPTSREYAQACGVFASGIAPRRGNKASIVHLDQPALTNAVAGAEKRDLADLWAWDKRTSITDISPLVACTLAAWGCRTLAIKPKAVPRAAWG